MLFERWSIMSLSVRHKLADRFFVRIYSHMRPLVTGEVADALLVGSRRNGSHFSNTLSLNLRGFLCVSITGAKLCI